MLKSSVLEKKAIEAGSRNIRAIPHSLALGIYKGTLQDLPEYLDTRDRRKLSFQSLRTVQGDVLEINQGLRTMTKSQERDQVSSFEGVLENLRDARDHLQVALGMFHLGEA